MCNYDVQLKGFGRSFQLLQRKRSSRVFQVSDSEAYVITLSENFWKAFDQMKYHVGMSDLEMVLDGSDYAMAHAQADEKSYAEGLQASLKLTLQLYRNTMHQADYGVVPANSDRDHNLFDESEMDELFN